MSRAVRVPSLAYLLVLLACLFLPGCSSDDDEEDGGRQTTTTTTPPVTAAPTAGPLTGRYRGTFVSNVAVGTGTVAVEFFQTSGNPTVTGTVTFAGSPCFRAGTVVGEQDGTAFNGTVQFGGGIVITLTATVTSNGQAVAGDYAVNMNTTNCSRDQGQFTLVR